MTPAGMSREDEVVESLVAKMRQHLVKRSRLLQRAVKEAPRLVDFLEKEGLLHQVSGFRSVVNVAGLDGSRQVIRAGLGRYIVIAITALVHLPQGLESPRAEVRYPLADVYEVHDPSGVDVEPAAEAGMLLLETLSMESIQGLGAAALMLDGPLVDPPVCVDPHVWRILESETLSELGGSIDYHGIRSEKLAKLVNEGVEAIGVVKRVSGLTLVSSITPRALSMLSGLSDEDLLLVISPIFRNKQVVIGPFEPQLPGRLGSIYKSRGLRIVTYYTYSQWTLRPLRVEIVSTGSDNVRHALETSRILLGLTPPGQSYPLPVQLAHEKSHLSRRLAQLVYREALSSLLVDEESALIARGLVEEP